jgi:hypothetical protein
LDGSGCGFTEILSQNFLGGAEENYVNPQIRIAVVPDKTV